MTGSSDNAPQNADQPSDQSAPKKPYNKPRLEVYGDLRKITGRVGLRGQPDHLRFLATHA